MENRQRGIETAVSLMRMALGLLDRAGERSMAAYLASALDAGGYEVPFPDDAAAGETGWADDRNATG